LKKSSSWGERRFLIEETVTGFFLGKTKIGYPRGGAEVDLRGGGEKFRFARQKGRKKKLLVKSTEQTPRESWTTFQENYWGSPAVGTARKWGANSRDVCGSFGTNFFANSTRPLRGGKPGREKKKEADRLLQPAGGSRFLRGVRRR